MEKLPAPLDDDKLPTVEYGPRMLALPNDKWRAFVVALFDEDAPEKGKGLFQYAAMTAGFGKPTSSAK
jgi:hypothetical protein